MMPSRAKSAFVVALLVISSEVQNHSAAVAALARDIPSTAAPKVNVDAAAERARIAALSKSDWRADLYFLADQLQRRHGNVFHLLRKADYDREVRSLDARLGQMDADEIFVGIDEIANSVGDGHTYLRFPVYTPVLPLRFAAIGARFRLVNSKGEPSAMRAEGWSLVAVDGIEVAEVRKRLLLLTPTAETVGLRRERAAALLSNGLALHGLRISRSASEIQYTLKEESGRVRTIVARGAVPDSATGRLAVDPGPGISSGSGLACTMLKGRPIEYCDFRSYDDLALGGAKMLQLAQEAHPTRLIIDLRNNTGGDFCAGLADVVEPVARDRRLNRPGALFILVGPRTFSAGMSNAVHFRQLTSGLLVGSMIGERPNSYQEARDMTLPHSGWIARYSTHFYRFSRDRGNAILPDKVITTTWEDYNNGIDPVLGWALTASATVTRRREWTSLGAKAAEAGICVSQADPA